ncbi:MAG: tRNA (adenosine(37)-N6)-threonylcarbamoyltransferase complex ATPase subunit type 1 TsaE [Flavobacteriia bacterium]|nr:tRNA (adenosine(37)-N6)-threonylcarbamoyltransferase complex ATPase subunit type 1 TsaE [Flavobacteriia bacterium]
MELEINNLNELPEKAIQFFNELNHRKVIAFDGQMGAGKTTFITAILKAIGVEDIEGSPTYSIVNVYDSPAYGKIYHFDLYRLNSEIEAFDIGIEEMLYSGCYCFIEWPEKIQNLLPENTIWVYIRTTEDNRRTISFEL